MNLQQAILTARQHNPSIGVRVKQGKLQAVNVTFAKRGKSTVTPLSEWMTMADIIAFLQGIN